MLSLLNNVLNLKLMLLNPIISGFKFIVNKIVHWWTHATCPNCDQIVKITDMQNSIWCKGATFGKICNPCHSKEQNRFHKEQEEEKIQKYMYEERLKLEAQRRLELEKGPYRG